jgi:hypothetical protein
MFSGRTIDLCKMDIEGAEEEVILDPRSGNAVLGRIRYLLIEIHHERSALDIVSRLCSFGLNRVAGEHDDTNLGVSLFVNRSLAPAHRRSVSVRESEHRS